MANAMLPVGGGVLVTSSAGPTSARSSTHHNQNSRDLLLPRMTTGMPLTSCLSSTSILAPTALSGAPSPPSTTASSLGHRKKSVEFRMDATTVTIPTPNSSDQGVSKRARLHNGPWTAKQVVNAISTSISPREREEAVHMAKDSFNHDVQAVHDDEFASGADAALVKHLTFLVYHQQQQQQHRISHSSRRLLASSSSPNSAPMSLSTEISLTCDAMESLYRASSTMVGASFARMGQDLMHLLTMLLQEELDRREQQLQQRLEQQPSSSHERNSQPSQQQQGSQGAQLSSMSCSSFVRRLLQEDSSDKLDLSNTKLSTSSLMIDQDDPPANDVRSSTAPNGQFFERRPITPPGLDLVDEPADHEQGQASYSTLEGDLLLRKATKLLGHFARVGAATEPMAHYPGLLSTLLRLLSLQRPLDSVPWDARLSALWILANLACNTVNMEMMVDTSGLISALVNVACRPLHQGYPLEKVMEILRSRSIASRAILNLSWSNNNKTALAEEHPNLIDMLAELMVHRHPPHHVSKSSTVREILVTTRRHAAGALRNMAAGPRRVKMGLCEYRQGHLLDVLTDAGLNDPDAQVKDRAFAAIHNLAIKGTAEKMVHHPALVLALKSALTSSEECEWFSPHYSLHHNLQNSSSSTSQHDLNMQDEGSPKSHASATLLVLERSITPDMGEAYDKFRDLLESINPTPTHSDDNQEDHEFSGQLTRRIVKRKSSDEDDIEMNTYNTNPVEV